MLETAGAAVITSASALRSMFTLDFERGTTLRQMHRVSVESLPVLAAVSLLAGGIMVIESAAYVEMTGTHTMLGWAFGLTTLSEVAPVLVALIFAGRSGSRSTAELGTMGATGQIDAIRLLGVDPARHLAAPRFIAMTLTLPLMIAICDALALFSGIAGAALVVHVRPGMFISSMVESRLLDEFAIGVIKGFFFGSVIAAISCTFGLRARGGASGVGRAVNDSVVASALAVFVVDYLITVAWLGIG